MTAPSGDPPPPMARLPCAVPPHLPHYGAPGTRGQGGWAPCALAWLWLPAAPSPWPTAAHSPAPPSKQPCMPPAQAACVREGRGVPLAGGGVLGGRGGGARRLTGCQHSASDGCARGGPSYMSLGVGTVLFLVSQRRTVTSGLRVSQRTADLPGLQGMCHTVCVCVCRCLGVMGCGSWQRGRSDGGYHVCPLAVPLT